ncbi:hypothetical protein SCLCIDRAFT_6332 [Scleroderma citrinum Foug A]|uniref:DNA polymerase epsilon subunit D n=1 Tax=Scleroderma citrinum Foug A TaxID=1036808 RepID=A0A0C3B0T3_9AGAM|nr:hypothetical protein SCLCIDRAFT_6332 [Scleroderma citrinum Foug A]
MPRKDAGGGPISAQAQQDLVSEGIENFELPKSLVTRIAKSAIPDNAKLQKETVLSLVKGSTVFINYLALSKQHKSISASDVLKALEMIEFGDLVDKLQEELQIHRDNTKNDKTRKSGVSLPPKLASTQPRAKGKEKASLPPPFTTAPRDGVFSSISHSGPQVAPLDGANINGEDDEMGDLVPDGVDEEAEDEVEDPGEYDEEEEEEREMPRDTIVIEDDELRRDAVGLDSRDDPDGDPQ